MKNSKLKDVFLMSFFICGLKNTLHEPRSWIRRPFCLPKALGNIIIKISCLK